MGVLLGSERGLGKGSGVLYCRRALEVDGWYKIEPPILKTRGPSTFQKRRASLDWVAVLHDAQPQQQQHTLGASSHGTRRGRRCPVSRDHNTASLSVSQRRGGAQVPACTQQIITQLFHNTLTVFLAPPPRPPPSTLRSSETGAGGIRQTSRRDSSARYGSGSSPSGCPTGAKRYA